MSIDCLLKTWLPGPCSAGKQILKRGLEMNSAKDGDRTLLDTDAKTPRVEEFENALRSLIIGQEPAIHMLTVPGIFIELTRYTPMRVIQPGT